MLTCFWPASLLIVLSGFASVARAQDTLVLDTYTCAQFLADVGDRADSAKVRRSLMMISWAAGYAAARQKDAIGSLEIAVSLGDVCRNVPTEMAVKAITNKIDELASRDTAPPLTPGASVVTGAPAAASAPPALSTSPVVSTPPAVSPMPSAAPAVASADRSFTLYIGRDMEGGDYHKQRNVSSDQCEKMCKRDSRCQAYSYDAWNRYCFLKSAIGPLRLEPRSVTFVANGVTISYDERAPIIQRRQQKSFPNEPYLQAKAQSYGDCAQRCLRDKRCEGFNFYVSARRCNLIEKPKEYSDDRTADVGIKVQGTP